jgi:hypothetical protein
MKDTTAVPFGTPYLLQPRIEYGVPTSITHGGNRIVTAKAEHGSEDRACGCMLPALQTKPCGSSDRSDGAKRDRHKLSHLCAPFGDPLHSTVTSGRLLQDTGEPPNSTCNYNCGTFPGPLSIAQTTYFMGPMRSFPERTGIRKGNSAVAGVVGRRRRPWGPTVPGMSGACPTLILPAVEEERAKGAT